MGNKSRTGNFGCPYYPKGTITPKVGDIVYYDWNSNNSSDHVEIVVSVNENSKTFTSIGGNTKGDKQGSEGVRRHSNVSFTASIIAGFECPNYPKSEEWHSDLLPVNLGDSFCALISNATTGGYLHNEGWNVTAYPGDSSDKQAWIFNRQNDNSYVIASTYDTNKLTVYNHEDNNCTSVIVTADDIDSCQKWYIYQVGSNYVLRPSHSGRVMDLSGGGTAAGTIIQIFEYNNTPSQKFKIEKKTWTNYMTPDNYVC